MPTWLYLTICLVTPQLWGVAVALTFAWWARRRSLVRDRSGDPPDYSV